MKTMKGSLAPHQKSNGMDHDGFLFSYDSDNCPLSFHEEDSVSEQDCVMAKTHSINDPKSPLQSDFNTLSHSRKWRRIRSSIQMILLDLPLCLLFVMLLLFVSLEHVHDEYLQPLGYHLLMDDERLDGQYLTYYGRSCDENDVTTGNVGDILLPPNFDLDDAVDKMLLHGVTVVPNVLKESTAEAMREYILAKNANLKTTETYRFLHGPKNRWLFYHGSEEDPSIVEALRQIAYHPTLRPFLDRLVGHSPTVVEFSTITAGFGAKAQDWHQDLLSSFHQNHARTFLPQYSLFIPLQNTTADMGATAVSPGTHMCNRFSDSYSDSDQFPRGFQVITKPADDKNPPLWKAGDCVVMNQRTLHRGEAHTNINGPSRAMLIISITSKQSKLGYQSRIPSLGSMNQMRSDMYGHTLDDFGHADVAMVQPWATLRSLGLMALPGQEWGWDYVTSAVIRIVNNDAGFDDSDDGSSDFMECLENGCGLYFPPIDNVPSFLRGGTDSGWWIFLVESLDACMFFTILVYLGSLSVYLLLVIYLPLIIKSVLSQKKIVKKGIDGVTSTAHTPDCSPRKALRSIICLHGAILFVFLYCLHYVNTTKWAKGIKSGSLYKPQSLNSLMEEMIKELDQKKIDKYTVTTLTKGDVLIKVPINSEPEQASNLFLDYHPGNRQWRNLISDYVSQDTPMDYLSPLICKALSRAIVQKITKQQGLFLSQHKLGAWLVLSEDEAVELTETEIVKKIDGLVSALDGALLTMLGQSFYGKSHVALISRTFTPQIVKKWRKILFGAKTGGNPEHNLNKTSRPNRIRPKCSNDEIYRGSLQFRLS